MKKLLMLMIAGLFLTAGCTPYKSSFQKDIPSSPEKFKYSLKDSAKQEDMWWKSFNDPVLNSLMEKMFENSPDIAKAVENTKRFEALFKKDNAGRNLQFSVNSGLSRNLNRSMPYEDRYYNQYSLSASAAFELDVWNRLKNTAQASYLDALSSTNDLKALYITLSANMADAYFLLVERKKRLTLLSTNMKISEQRLFARLEEYESGVSDFSKLLEMYSGYNSLKSTVADLRKDISLAENSISLLVGITPAELEKIDGGSLDIIPPALPVSAPADVLKNRPDIKTAFEGIQAADLRVAAAVANRYPNLKLGAAVSNSAYQFAYLFNPMWHVVSIFAEAGLTVFDGGAKKAAVEEKQALLKQEIYTYKKAVLTAVKEVEDALVKNIEYQNKVETLEDIKETNAKLLKLTEDRYKGGLVTLSDLLSITQEYYSSLMEIAYAKRQLISSRIELARVIGGNWPNEFVNSEKDR